MSEFHCHCSDTYRCPMHKHDPFSAHEVLHTTHIMSEMFDRYVLEHAFTESDPDILCAATKISMALGALYQELGKRTL